MELVHYFTDRYDGFSKNPHEENNLGFHVKDDEQNVKLNRSLTCKNLCIKNVQFMNQIHSNDVKIISKIQDEITCDGLITNEKNIALAVMVADCIPILLYDRKNHVIAALHAGRAGAFKNIVGVCIEKMKVNFNTNPTYIKAWIGPSIKECCYEVGGEILRESMEKFPLYVKNGFLDIRGIIKEQLQSFDAEVKDISICTNCDADYFSYRRDKKTGRFAGIIMLKDINV